MRRTARLFRAAAVAVLTAAGGPALAQQHYYAPPAIPCPPVPCPPGAAAPAPLPQSPTAVPAAPATAPQFAADDTAPSFGGTLSGAGLGSSTAVNPGGYIDGAIPVTQFRLRYDSAYRNNRPDRAEFFYPKCGCFRTGNPPQLDADGPPFPDFGNDYQELSSYLEGRLGDRLSVFGEVPIRFIDPVVNNNTSGLSDVSFGFKYAAVLTDCRVVTFQLRTTAPTGDGFKGLGMENWRVEPGILWQTRPADRLTLFGEVRDSIPVSDNSDYAGNVLRYGIGSAYMLASTPNYRVLPVAEFVGWSVLSGRESAIDIDPGRDASGVTIVNAKVGVRFGFGEVCDPGTLGRSDLYVGYGRALTGEVWYKDMFRIEYRRRF